MDFPTFLMTVFSGFVGAVVSIAAGYLFWLAQKKHDYVLFEEHLKAEVKKCDDIFKRKTDSLLTILHHFVESSLSGSDVADFNERINGHNPDKVFDAIFPINSDDIRLRFVEENLDIISELDVDIRQAVLKAYNSYSALIRASLLHNEYIKTAIHYGLINESTPSENAHRVAEDRKNVCKKYFPTLKGAYNSMLEDFVNLKEML